MVLAVTFNSLEYAQKLEKAGMSKELAEVQAQAQFEILSALIEDHAVTKQDITNIRHDIKDIRHDITEVKRDIQELRKSNKRDLELTSKQIIIKVGYMMSGAVFILIAMMKLLHI